MVVMSRIHAMSCETAHKKKIGTFVRRNTYKGSVISEPPLNSYQRDSFQEQLFPMTICSMMLEMATMTIII